MRFASLGSGSKGNATLIEAGDTLVLVDCGFTLKETRVRLAARGLELGQLSAILVTHEHGDHIRGVGPVARQAGCPVYSSFGTACAVEDKPASLRNTQWQEVRPGRAFRIGELEVLPVLVPHDAREPCQYRFGWQQRTLGVLTDLGSITPHVVDAYSECDALVLECNHDPRMLANGPYPASLKRRVGGMLGHLSNAQAAALLRQANTDRLQHLVLSHLSEQNNTATLALAEIQAALDTGHERIGVASQNQGFDWLQVI
ncbi:MAG: MBL fold metallo-hydrolase [Pseudomonadales bacterium]|nr:MBL fold metallo-hydrolase [Pseudomonadales bacterium]